MIPPVAHLLAEINRVLEKQKSLDLKKEQAVSQVENFDFGLKPNIS